MHHSITSPSIHYQIYHLIANCTVHRRRPLEKNKICCLCFQDTNTVTPEKLYTRKELVTTEHSIADFHTSFYIPEIKKLAFHLTNVRILGNNHCGNTRR